MKDVSFVARIPRHFHRDLKELSKKTDLSMNQLIKIAISDLFQTMKEEEKEWKGFYEKQ